MLSQILKSVAPATSKNKQTKTKTTPVAYTATVANTVEAGGTWPGGLFEGFGPTCLQAGLYESNP